MRIILTFIREDNDDISIVDSSGNTVDLPLLKNCLTSFLFPFFLSLPIMARPPMYSESQTQPYVRIIHRVL